MWYQKFVQLRKINMNQKSLGKIICQLSTSFHFKNSLLFTIKDNKNWEKQQQRNDMIMIKVKICSVYIFFFFLTSSTSLISSLERDWLCPFSISSLISCSVLLELDFHKSFLTVICFFTIKNPQKLKLIPEMKIKSFKKKKKKKKVFYF